MSTPTQIKPALAIIAPPGATLNEIAIIVQANKRFQDINKLITNLTQSCYPVLTGNGNQFYNSSYPLFRRVYAQENGITFSSPPTLSEITTYTLAVYTDRGIIPMGNDSIVLYDTINFIGVAVEMMVQREENVTVDGMVGFSLNEKFYIGYAHQLIVT